MARALKLTSLSPADQALIPVVRDEWLRHGLSTQPADRPAAEAAFAEAYRAAGLESPTVVIWLQSPLQGAMVAAVLASKTPQVWAQVGAQVWAQVGAQVGDQVGAQVRAQVRGQVWAQVWAQVRGQVWAQVRDQVWAQVRDQVWAQVRDQLSRACYGQHDSNWLGFYETFQRVGEGRMADTIAPLTGLISAAQSCGWWWPFQGLVIATERPRALHRDEQHRLHYERGMALEYPDGWGIYAIHGVRVPAQVILAPETLTAPQIRDEQNAEIRRVMLERFGQERYLLEIGATEIHRDEWGILYRAELGDDEPLVMVKVINSTAEPDGSFRDYYLRVPPAMRTAHEAIAWTCGETAATYRPLVET